MILCYYIRRWVQLALTITNYINDYIDCWQRLGLNLHFFCSLIGSYLLHMSFSYCLSNINVIICHVWQMHIINCCFLKLVILFLYLSLFLKTIQTFIFPVEHFRNWFAKAKQCVPFSAAETVKSLSTRWNKIMTAITRVFFTLFITFCRWDILVDRSYRTNSSLAAVLLRLWTVFLAGLYRVMVCKVS